MTKLNAIYGTSLWIPKECVAGLQAMKNTLEFDYGEKKRIRVWKESRDYIIVPREFIDIGEYDSLPFAIDNRCPNTYPQIRDIKTTYKLRDYIQEEAKEGLLKGSGLLVLSCGKGKTVVTLHAWAELKVPAVVVVPTLDLAHQWKSRIIEHTDVNENEIGWIQGSPENWNIENKLITIAVLKTLSMYSDSFTEKHREHYGCYIYDEVHRLGAPSFNVVASIGYGIRWGLSATPERSDGLDPIYRYHLGPTLYKNTTQENIPNVYFLKTLVSLNTEQERKLKVRGDIHFAKLVTFLSESEKRNKTIIKFLEKCIEDKREVLVLSDRVDHLKNLHSFFPDSGIIHGSVKGEEREKVLNENKIIFASNKIAKEGLDKKTLNTVFITTPFSDPGIFTQVMGRAQRASDPVIVIFEDDVSLCRAITSKLRKQLNNLKYHFTDITIL